MADFLFEIGLEEIPARMIAAAEAELVSRTIALLARERLVKGEVDAKGYSTPRRLAVLVRGVLDRQDDLTEELLGPAAKVAYKDGVAGPAALAFAKKANVDVADLTIVVTSKGEYCAATTVRLGRPAAEILAEQMPKEIAGIYWAKTMYWRAGKPERFVRPLRWLVGMLGAEVVPIQFGGYEAGSVTFGHRVLFGGAPIPVTPETYLHNLLGGFVMADVAVRRHAIRKALDRVCRLERNKSWREDHELVDKMTHMTEWPSVIRGNFEGEFLALPPEVLVTVMRDHQNYFALEDDEGKLAPHFLAILNTAPGVDAEQVIRHGNERVLRARFSDARFFWEFDQRMLLKDRVALLDQVTFQKDLGSYGSKSLRVIALAAELGKRVYAAGGSVDLEGLKQAAVLAKTDLTTELVKEFTELQGVVGGLYARSQGYPETVVLALYDHYKPVSMEDGIPRTLEGALLAIADKADTIGGMFGLGMEPTGSRDPFALRRAANGIVKILAESTLQLGLGEIARAAVGDDETLISRVEVFLAERLEYYLRDVKKLAYDVVAAVLAVGADQVRDAVARAEAVSSVRRSEDFAAVSTAFKRMKNILAQAAQSGVAIGRGLDVALLAEGAELDLAAKAADVKPVVAKLRSSGEYVRALELIATMRPQVDAFFENVMVMDPDEAVRWNRLALLERVLGDFGGIADFSEIVVVG